MSRKYIIFTLMIVMITLVVSIQGELDAPLPKCESGFSYYNGCNGCLCDLAESKWLCTTRWCGGIRLIKPPCLCE
ncbi:PREDICTED: uncharacterized protein LOC108749237 [Trachymyrmex septentrionalis]|uniref:uncharacterized protein LOC108749237 n=1 Tax=Trachymyrmex septentrionalis TaxID=34720 RepID=UPI00084F30AE|nr:PREDICTED: uncharacterized protein LOC108749237 [Trachymyrmex septentrionalis]